MDYSVRDCSDCPFHIGPRRLGHFSQCVAEALRGFHSLKFEASSEPPGWCLLREGALTLRIGTRRSDRQPVEEAEGDNDGQGDRLRDPGT